MERADTTETIWFRIFALVATAIIAGYSIANIVYYNRIRKAVTVSSTVTRGEATAMMWFSIIVFIVSTIMFIWAIVRIILGSRTRARIAHQVTTFVSSDEGIATAAGQGYRAMLREPPKPTAVPRTAPLGVSSSSLAANRGFGAAPPAISASD